MSMTFVWIWEKWHEQVAFSYGRRDRIPRRKPTISGLEKQKSPKVMWVGKFSSNVEIGQKQRSTGETAIKILDNDQKPKIRHNNFSGWLMGYSKFDNDWMFGSHEGDHNSRGREHFRVPHNKMSPLQNGFKLQHIFLRFTSIPVSAPHYYTQIEVLVAKSKGGGLGSGGGGGGIQRE